MDQLIHTTSPTLVLHQLGWGIPRYVAQSCLCILSRFNYQWQWQHKIFPCVDSHSLTSSDFHLFRAGRMLSTKFETDYNMVCSERT